MKITFSNKKADSKPSKEKAGLFFGKIGTTNRIQFKTGNFNLDTFEKIIGNGHVLAYQCKDDDAMNRKNGYIGTQYIIVDVDAVDYTMDELLSSIKYKPTIIHTTYSNLTPNKDNKYCYHLIYCLNDVLYGEDNFYNAFNYFSNDYDEIVDKAAKDCHRIAFTSNSTLDNYEYRNLGIVYDVNEIVTDNEDDFDDFFSASKNSPSTSISSNTNNIGEEKNEAPKENLQNTYSVDETFFSDFMRLPYSEFLTQYSLSYKVQYETTYTADENKSFVDLSDVDYYIVNPTKFKWNNEKKKFEKVIVRDGNRHNQLFKDAIQFKYVNPEITLEQLVISITDDFYKFYDKSNCKIDKRAILDLAKEIYNGNYNGMTTNKNRAVNKAYFQDKTFVIDGVEVSGERLTKQQKNGISAKDMKDEQLLSCYDDSICLEDNYTIIKSIYPCKKARLIEALERNGIEYFSSKDDNKKFVLDLYLQNPTLSSRKIEEICKDRGMKISDSTICRILKKYKAETQNQ